MQPVRTFSDYIFICQGPYTEPARVPGAAPPGDVPPPPRVQGVLQALPAPLRRNIHRNDWSQARGESRTSVSDPVHIEPDLVSVINGSGSEWPKKTGSGSWSVKKTEIYLIYRGVFRISHRGGGRGLKSILTSRFTTVCVVPFSR